MQSSSFGRRGQTAGGQTSPVQPLSRRIPAPEPVPAMAVAAPTGSPHEWVIPSDDEALPQVPWLTFGIIALLAAVFIAQEAFGFEPGASQSLRSVIALGGDSRQLVFGQGQWWRPLTAVLLHGNVQHIFGNCIALLIAGVMLEKRLGRAWFAAIFVVGGIGGSLASLVWGSGDKVGCGASGAIMALMIPVLVETFGNATVYTPKRMRGWVLLTVIGALIPTSSEIDYSAHFGGALVGGVMGYVLLIAAPKLHEAQIGRRIAAGIAIAGGVAAAIGFVMVAIHYPAYRAHNAVLIPDAEIKTMQKTLSAPAGSSDPTLALVTQYPQDPRSHMFRAISLAKTNQLDQAEEEIRDALAEQDALRNDMPSSLQTSLHGLLALIVLSEGQRDEAMAEARPVCTAPASAPELKGLKAELDKQNLCAASPS
jgi:rhomboid protease GluP